ncbi:DUF5994 family protein [Streptomyces sp. NBC_01795]|uniref:DUF5994 family protein n=1 Tax=unclassified Streptomyces TaxID=2593676 RepID=UPI002DDC6362|nr:MULTISPECIES: DUF5994 family protein [unclassified Streptomyces]WSA93502.1 DUF5994 family protein [Streptomyces sp. NBC_01795]WSS13881.1 DUF5994 family protein [Streptomyces sp. NBC_01186]
MTNSPDSTPRTAPPAPPETAETIGPAEATDPVGPAEMRRGHVVLVPDPERSREGILDGAWWPSSRDVGAELPGLVAALTELLGPITRVGVDTEAWDGVQKPLFVRGQLIHIDWFPLGDDTVIVTRGEHDHFSLLAIPPEATYEEAQAAFHRAVHPDNQRSGTQILATGGLTRDA